MNSSTKYFNEKNELWGITEWTVRKSYTILFWKSRYTKKLWGEAGTSSCFNILCCYTVQEL